jgi:predicted transcriptional regulator
MKPPCIIVVRYVLPALRVLIARELIEKHGLSRVRAAEKMELTPAAITQYLKKVRGETAIQLIESSDETVKIISEMASDLAKVEASVYDVLQNICKVCQIMRSNGLLCEMHKEILPALKKLEVCTCEFRLPCIP